MKTNVGKYKMIDATDMKDSYGTLKNRDMTAADLLERQGLYNQAIYMYIQGMEKEIKAYICGKVNAANPYFSQKLRDVGHSLDKSIDFLIELLAGNDESLKTQLAVQIKEGVFQDIYFAKLYNDCRYPNYNQYKEQYHILELGREDCERIRQISQRLTQYIRDFDRLR